jgi:HSP20 family protein
MTLTRRPSERSITPWRDVVDWMFRSPWAPVFDGDGLSSAAMAVDLRETDDAFIVEAELPGIKPEDTELTLDGRTLTIRGRYGETREEGGKGERYLLRERRAGEMARSIVLPAAVDPDKVTSMFEQGELKISLPKAAEGRARRIPIGSGASGTGRIGSTG